jgi:hypothetical protein
MMLRVALLAAALISALATGANAQLVYYNPDNIAGGLSVGGAITGALGGRIGTTSDSNSLVIDNSTGQISVGAAAVACCRKAYIQSSSDTDTTAANAHWALELREDYKPSGDNSGNPKALDGNLWLDATANYTGLPSAVVGNSYTIPQASVTSVAVGGSGYTNGDTLTVQGGTLEVGLSAVALRLTAIVSGGVVTGATVSNPTSFAYTTLPANPVSVTGGTGTGATFNISWDNVAGTNLTGTYGRAYHRGTGTWTFASSLYADANRNNTVGTITNAVGLYVNTQTAGTNNYGIYFPGAAASGSIGAATNTDITINTAGSGILKTNQQLRASTGTTCQANMTADGAAAYYQAVGGTNCVTRIQAQGTGNASMGNANGIGFSVTTPASVINSVLVTGAVTGSVPIISTSGDANRNVQLGGSGTSDLGVVGAYGTATASAGAATVNLQRGLVTSESITTAAGSDYVLTLTNARITASSLVFCTADNGTNTTEGLACNRVTPASGSATMRIRNTHASAALNGTIKIGFLVAN